MRLSVLHVLSQFTAIKCRQPSICAAVVDAPAGTVTLGANVANGIEQKGIDTLSQCIKKCAAAGLGIPATVSAVGVHFSGPD